MYDTIKVLIEVPKNSKVKYEMDKDSNTMKADRIVAFPYPENYGYVPDTLADDGDPLDIFVISEHEMAPGTTMEVIIVGMVEMLDNKEKDHKLVAVFLGEDELPHTELRIKAIRNFLTIYKPNVQLGLTVDEIEAGKYFEYCKDKYAATKRGRTTNWKE